MLCHIWLCEFIAHACMTNYCTCPFTKKLLYLSDDGKLCRLYRCQNHIHWHRRGEKWSTWDLQYFLVEINNKSDFGGRHWVGGRLNWKVEVIVWPTISTKDFRWKLKKKNCDTFFHKLVSNLPSLDTNHKYFYLRKKKKNSFTESKF